MPAASTVLLLLGSLVAYGVSVYIQGLRSNLAAARKTGLPYTVIPVSPFNVLWQLTSQTWTPIIRLFPKAWWEPWLEIMQPDWSYRFLRGPWDRLGDSFLLVAPKEIILWTCDAQVIHQITSRREAFPKQTSNYKILSIFGRNMLAAEGAEWKMHRKGVSASFNEKNAAHIFTESIKQTQGMIAHWMRSSDVDGRDGSDSRKALMARSPTINTLEHDTMTLALNIIAHVGFGLRLLWPGQKMPEDADAKSKRYGSAEPPKGHSLTFADSLAMVLERILLVLIVPPWLLRVLPFQATRAAWAARWNYEEYMHEFLRDKTEAAQRHSEGEGEERGDEGMDIMGQLVRTKYGKNKKSYGSSKTQGTKPTADELTDSDIMGNSFVILLAGHETTANTLHFTLVELATNPAAQRALQADVDRLLGTDSDPLEWDYDGSINALMASHVAACMNETLRLTPSVADIPKEVSAGAEQTITLGSEGEEGGSGGRRRQHVLPRGTTIMLNTIGAHRNPRYWPSAAGEGDLDRFLPERWFRPSMSTRGEVAAAAAEEEQEEDYGGFQGPDTSAQLYRPIRGSFIPFSDGPRSCLGRRIAQVEMVAALAVLFQRYSVELAVDEWATNEDVEAMGPRERQALYEKARGKARETVRMASSLLTLKLHGELKVSVRLVQRGEERFLGLEDA